MRRLLLYLLFLAHGSSLFAQSFELSRTGDRYTLVSENAPLSDILAEIDRREAASLNFLGDYDQTITATHQDLTLDMLLYELGVSYVLTYEPDEDGNYHLSDAMLLESGESGVDGETAAMLRKLVQDLRNDDIPWNANKAVYQLREIGCPAIPFLEEALYDEDFQRRHVAADLMRTICPEHRPGPRLIDLTFELLDEEEIEFNLGYLLSYSGAFDYLASSNIYQSTRGRILQNLYSADARTRLYSALLAAHHRETALVGTLARIMIPHLADNDLANDAAACAYALHQLGPAVLPHLQPYRHSSDIQQAELVHLICTALETDTTPEFRPVMFASYHRMPIEDSPRIYVNGWPRHRFPDSNGQYTNLKETRMTVADYYGVDP